MAKYKIKDQHSGKTFTISGPDNATEDELQEAADEYVRQNPHLVEPTSASERLHQGLDLAWEGLKQAVGQSNEDKVKALKEKYSTDDPSGKIIQTIGEMAPSALMGTGAAMPLSLGARSAIMAASKKGIPLLPTTLKLLRTPAESALASGISAGLLPSTEGNQLENAGEGAAIGAAIPPIVGAPLKVASYLIKPLTKGAQRQQAAETILKALKPEDVSRTIEVAKNYKTDPILGTDHTTAAINDSLELMALQKALRNRDPAKFTDLEQTNDVLRRKFLEDKIPSEDSVNLMKMQRDDAIAPFSADLHGEADVPGLVDQIKAARSRFVPGGTLDDLYASTQRGLSSGMYDSKGELLATEDAAPISDIDRLLEVRAELINTLKGKPSSLFSPAARGNSQIMDQIDMIDSTLDDATNGAYSQYNQAYGKASEPINEAEALTNIGEGVADRNLTSSTLTRLLKKFGQDEFGPTMSASSTQDIEHLINDLRMQEKPLAIKATGADTFMNSNLDQALLDIEAPILGFRSKLLGAAKGSTVLNRAGRQRALVNMMTDPKLYATEMSALLRKMQGNEPITGRMIRRTLTSPLIQTMVGEE